ncbi:MAG: ABC transporter ATP-binding protein, partial [Acidimicrobiia bacterium]
SEAEKAAVELLRSVNIPEPERRVNEYPNQLSGGMRQRVMIAIAIACSPELLIADEPTTALDVTVQAQILELLAEKQREYGMAMILVTHDLGVVARRTDAIAVMYAGRVVEYAPTRVLFRETRMPYTHALLQAIPTIGAERKGRLRVIPGRPPDMRGNVVGCRFAARCTHVQDRCLQEEPPLLEGDTPGHLYRCWFPVGTPEGEAALARNEAAGNLVGATEGSA